MNRPGVRTFTHSLINISKASERSVMDVVEHAEMVEKELDAFIERRAKSNPDPDETEASYAESVRRYHARRRDQNRWAWIRYYEGLARCHTRLAEEHEARVRQLLEEGAV
jgi:hypothetical protein